MTTSLLTPAYELTLGSQLWTQQAIEIRVTLACAPQVDVLRARLPAIAPISAAVGDEVTLVLDSGEQKKDVFAGTIDSIRRSFGEIVVTAVDSGGVLARYRPATTYEQSTAGSVIRGLVDDAGLGTGSIDDGAELAFYVADPSRTAWEHVARLAAWGGAIATVSSKNEVNTTVIDATQAEFAVLYGRDLLAIAADDKQSAVDAWVVAGEGGAGSSSDPEATRPTTDFFAGNRPEGPAIGKRWRFEPALRTVKGAAAAGAALQRAYSASRASGRMQLVLQPQFRCGTVIEVQELPSGLPSGPLWLSRVEHVLGEHGGTTAVTFQRGGDSFDPEALLGSLAGAIGGLL